MWEVMDKIWDMGNAQHVLGDSEAICLLVSPLAGGLD